VSKNFEVRGDELDLYDEFHFELVRQVGRRVNTSPENVEDACAFAWLQFFKHQPDRDGQWKGWLYRVAQRRAYELDAHDRRDAHLVDEEGQAIDLQDPKDGHAERDEFIAAVQELRRLPTRLQRLVLLRTQVETQRELAQLLNLSPGRVSVLLAKAARLVEFAANAKQVPQPALPARAARLQELETERPVWLINAIGHPGGQTSPAALSVAWRRAALIVDDYRQRSGFQSTTEAIGPTPIDRDVRRAHRRAEQAIHEIAELRTGRSSTQLHER
jgi:RNA polymerase sigma factor (sigma-70 family)